MPATRATQFDGGAPPSGIRFGKAQSSDGLLLNLVDLTLALTVFAVPLLMGGRTPAGQLALALLASSAAALWLLHQGLQKTSRWTWSGAEPLLALGLGLVALQLVHLPMGVLETLSPRIGELLPLWTADGESQWSLGRWSQLSLAPSETESGLVTLTAYVLLFLVVVQRVEKVAHAERLIKLVAAAAMFMAAFGLIQYFTSNGKFFWFYQNPYVSTSSTVRGSFTNRNHFAHFLALGIGPLIWWLLKVVQQTGQPTSFGPSRTRRSASAALLLSAALAVVVFAGLLSLSRGGFLTMCAAGAVCTAAMYAMSLLSGRFLLGIGAVGLLLCGLLSVYGEGRIQGRIEGLVSSDLEQVDSGRQDIWAALLQAIPEFPLAGTGIGTHRTVYPIYLDEVEDGFEYTHAENGYLQVALEAGYTGLVLVLAGLGLCFYWCVRGIRRHAATGSAAGLAAVLAALCASTVHSLFDFVWYAPGCMVVVIVLAGCGCRLWQLNAPRAEAGAAPSPSPTRRLLLCGGVAPVVALALWMTGTTLPAVRAEPHWQEYIRLSMSHPDDAPVTAEYLQNQMAALAPASKANPHSARIQLATGHAYLRLFRFLQLRAQNAMPLTQIREAALASGFDSLQSRLEWVDRATEGNSKYLHAALRHTERSLALCPLEGSAYLNLSELAFLEDSPDGAPQQLLEQALLVRPYDARVLFAAGHDKLLRDDLEQALVYWQSAFAHSPTYQRNITRILAGSIPVEMLIERLQPDRAALGVLAETYRAVEIPEETQRVLRLFAAACVQDAQEETETRTALPLWLDAHEAYAELGDAKRSVECLQRALKLQPNAFEVRRAVGVWHFNRHDYESAAEHLAWCAARKPQDTQLKRMAETASRERLKGTTAVSSGGRKTKTF